MATLALSVAGQALGGAVGGPFGATIGRALGALAGSAIDQAIFGEKPAGAVGADIRLTGSSEGGAVPRLYGWGRLAGNIIWATELEELGGETSGAKGTAPGEDREIVASFAVALCEGEVARLGRVWADGQLLETAGLTMRFYSGSETQAADSLIEARQGADAAPAYRGLCYLVFERLPLGPFGNRIPNISVELCRVVGELEPAIRSVTLIPGATEFGYDPLPRVRVVAPGATATENAHQSALASDWTLSLDELCALCPNLEHVSLVVAWFGDDLRAGHCSVRPKVEAAARTVRGTSWSVAGLSRAAAGVVSTHAGGPAYGGTPSDGAVRAAVADLRERGLAVTLYPMLLMDIPADNPMAQPAYPWRGRITGAAGDVEAFVGAADGWGLRRMVRHYAALAAETGAEALVLGSELRGLTTIRDGGGGFPFVAALVGLAAEARGIAGPGVKLTYAADWSEYHGFQPEDAPGDKLFHLDPLWASDDIDAVGIDNYMPLADWRDGTAHADFAGGDGPHGLDYLAANVAGGEGFDWYYASAADRLAGLRTPITDSAHGEPWLWRFKDLAGWWGHAHHDRVDGVRAASPTGWVPGMKPIWFTELGCGAVDKGANQPNVFPDDKSAESGRPYFSSGAPDGLAQRQFLRAHLAHWQGPGNPVSAVYGGPMVVPERISLWTWDARPFPVFPAEAEIWSDAANHAAGHWLTGRLGSLAADEMIKAVATDHGIAIAGAVARPPLLHGMSIGEVATAREALGPVLEACGLALRDGPDGLVAVATAAVAAGIVPMDDLVDEGGPLLKRRRPDPGEATGRLALGYSERERDYLAATATAIGLPGAAESGEALGLVLDAAGARRVAERRLATLSGRRDTLEVTLPPRLAGLEPGDVIALEGAPDGPFEITELRDGVARRVVARTLLPPVEAMVLSDRPRRGPAVVAAAEPLLVAAQVPGTDGPSRLVLAAWAAPWPGQVDVLAEATGARLARLDRPATLGELLAPLGPGPLHLWDGQALELRLHGGHVASVADLAALGGANRLLVETDAGGWELLGFAMAELTAPGCYRLGRLLRGLDGTDPAMGAAAGNRVLLLDERVALVPVAPDWLGGTLDLRGFAGRLDATGIGFVATLSPGPELPLQPAHLRSVRDAAGDIAFRWVRRSRADAGGWAAEVPLDVLPEAYRVTIFDGGGAVRAIEVSSPAASYSAAEQVADFGAPPTSFDFTVAQLSPVFGPGHAAVATFHG